METESKKRPFNTIAYAAAVVAVGFLLAIPFFLKKEKDSVTYRKPLMGTVVEITLTEGDRPMFDGAANSSFAEIKRLEDLLSSYKTGSDVSKVSQYAGIKPVKVSHETIEVTEDAIMVSELSDGAFDPTIGVLGKVWGFSGEKGYVPDKKEIEGLLPLVNFKGIAVDEGSSTVGLKKNGMALNLGGIAKGYILGRAAEVLKRNGVERAIVKAGGDMVLFQKGGNKGGRPFIIGIQDPRNKDKLMGEVHVFTGAVSTSGDYERFFIKDGVRYHHILDPKTGFPANKAQSATVITENPALADGLSTAVFVMGAEKGVRLIESLPNTTGVVVDAGGIAHASKGFKGWLGK